MSDFSDKSLDRPHETPGRARQTLQQLRNSYGRRESSGRQSLSSAHDDTPEVIRRYSMGRVWVWKRVAGHGKTAEYELQGQGHG
jgi:hypothetical protein